MSRHEMPLLDELKKRLADHEKRIQELERTAQPIALPLHAIERRLVRLEDTALAQWSDEDIEREIAIRKTRFAAGEARVPRP